MRRYKPVVWGVLLLPLAWLVIEALTGQLGVRPLKQALRDTGWWALWLLVASLAITPIRRMTGWNGIIQIRRNVGVASFCYAALHVALYVAEQGFDLIQAAAEIVQRVYLVVGAIAWIVLAVLALTSTDAWIRRLRKRWQPLHRLVYLAAGLALLHYLQQARLDLSLPMAAVGIVLWLLVCRRLPRGGWRVAVAVGLLIALGTALAEAGYYAATRGVPVGAMLAATLDVEAGVRPALWVLAGSVAMAVMAVVRSRVRGAASQ
jgi:sulfoxide reductase heme-binding subunit YedZ